MKKLKLPKIPKNWEEDCFKLPRVLVEWVDATTVSGWWDMEGFKQKVPITVHTLGYLLPPHKEFVRIAPTVGAHGAFADPWMIPRVWIKSIKRIR